MPRRRPRGACVCQRGGSQLQGRDHRDRVTAPLHDLSLVLPTRALRSASSGRRRGGSGSLFARSRRIHEESRHAVFSVLGQRPPSPQRLEEPPRLATGVPDPGRGSGDGVGCRRWRRPTARATRLPEVLIPALSCLALRDAPCSSTRGENRAPLGVRRNGVSPFPGRIRRPFTTQDVQTICVDERCDVSRGMRWE